MSRTPMTPGQQVIGDLLLLAIAVLVVLTALNGAWRLVGAVHDRVTGEYEAPFDPDDRSTWGDCEDGRPIYMRGFCNEPRDLEYDGY